MESGGGKKQTARKQEGHIQRDSKKARETDTDRHYEL